MAGVKNRETRGISPINENERYSTKKLIYPAASRNQGPILDVWFDQLPKYFSLEQKLFCLEIASGSGQHAAHFAPKFPNITFQPSDFEEDVLGSIGIYADECRTKNIKKPLHIDIRDDLGKHGFQKESIDLIYCCNMVQVSPYDCSISLFKNAGKYLKPKGVMITYGPYAFDGVISPQSNVDFDLSLKARNEEWGIRCITKLTALAKENNITLQNVFDLPANNKCAVWLKEG